MTGAVPSKPILLYDGDCRFCTAGVSRWHKQPIVEVLPVQEGAGVPFGLDPDKPMGAIHLVNDHGAIRKGAAAVFRMMELCGDLGGGVLWNLYCRSGWFRALSDRGYAWVAARRAKLSAVCSTGRCSLGDS
jgi:predicted DCC family thiol-disulfide oxidoreductase YuxK